MTPKCVMERRHKTATVGSRGRRRRVSERGAQLIEKQKARYIYGLYERQFKRFYGIAAKQPGITGDTGSPRRSPYRPSLARSRRLTESGSRAEPSPPSPATSLANDDETNE